MNSARPSLLLALTLFSGLISLAGTTAQAQTKVRRNTEAFSKTIDIPYFQIQVLYLSTYSANCGWNSGPYSRPCYRYYWITVAETDNLAEAEAIYDLYLLAQNLGVLNDVVPKKFEAYPLQVRMVTQYRTETLGGSASFR